MSKNDTQPKGGDSEVEDGGKRSAGESPVDRIFSRGIIAGTGYFHSSYPVWFRIAWTLIVLLMTGMMMYQIIQLFVDYRAKPIDLDITYKYPRQLRFPNLLICPSRQFKLSKIYREYGFEVWNYFRQHRNFNDHHYWQTENDRDPDGKTKEQEKAALKNRPPNHFSEQVDFRTVFQNRTLNQQYIQRNWQKLLEKYGLTDITKRMRILMSRPQADNPLLNPDTNNNIIAVSLPVPDSLNRLGALWSVASLREEMDRLLLGTSSCMIEKRHKRRKRQRCWIDPEHEFKVVIAEMADHLIHSDPNMDFQAFLRDVSPTLDDILVGCHYGKTKQSCWEMFRERWTMFGKCFELNAASYPSLMARDTSMANGMEIILHSDDLDDIFPKTSEDNRSISSGDFMLWSYATMDQLSFGRPISEFDRGMHVILPIRRTESESENIDCRASESYSRHDCILRQFRLRCEAECKCVPFVGGNHSTSVPPGGKNEGDSSLKCRTVTELICVAGLKADKLNEIEDECSQQCSTQSYHSVPQYSNSFQQSAFEESSRRWSAGGQQRMNHSWVRSRNRQLTADLRGQFARLPDSFLHLQATINRTNVTVIRRLRNNLIEPMVRFLDENKQSLSSASQGKGSLEDRSFLLKEQKRVSTTAAFRSLYFGLVSELILIENITSYVDTVHLPSGGVMGKSPRSAHQNITEEYRRELLDLKNRTGMLNESSANLDELISVSEPYGKICIVDEMFFRPILRLHSAIHQIHMETESIPPESFLVFPIDAIVAKESKYLWDTCTMPCPMHSSDPSRRLLCTPCRGCLRRYNKFRDILYQQITCYGHFGSQYPVFLHYLEQLNAEVMKTIPLTMKEKTHESWSILLKDQSPSLEKLIGLQALPSDVRWLFEAHETLIRLRKQIRQIEQLISQVKFTTAKFKRVAGKNICGFDREKETEIIRITNISRYSSLFESDSIQKLTNNFLESIEDVVKLKKQMTSFDKMDESYLRRNTASISLYYSDLVVEVVTKSSAYSFWKMLSDVGGSLGLYFGCCLVTLFELIFACSQGEEKVKTLTTPEQQRLRNRAIALAFIQNSKPSTNRTVSHHQRTDHCPD